jgi:hypothetical protein
LKKCRRQTNRAGLSDPSGGARTIFFVFNNRRYGVLQNVAKQLGYGNAVAGRFVGKDIADAISAAGAAAAPLLAETAASDGSTLVGMSSRAGAAHARPRVRIRQKA